MEFILSKQPTFFVGKGSRFAKLSFGQGSASHNPDGSDPQNKSEPLKAHAPESKRKRLESEILPPSKFNILNLPSSTLHEEYLDNAEPIERKRTKCYSYSQGQTGPNGEKPEAYPKEDPIHLEQPSPVYTAIKPPLNPYPKTIKEKPASLHADFSLPSVDILLKIINDNLKLNESLLKIHSELTALGVDVAGVQKKDTPLVSQSLNVLYTSTMSFKKIASDIINTQSKSSALMQYVFLQRQIVQLNNELK